MSGTARDVIRVAKGEVGYHEGYSGGHWNNHQKFSPAVPSLEWSQNQAWCATFVSWCFQEAGMPRGSYLATASVAAARDWWKQHGRFSEYPAVGAQCIMGVSGSAHTGLVYAYDATYIYTVEGNTNSSGSAEGDGVYLKKRARRDSYVYGYGYPAYPGGIVTADPNWKNPTAPATQEDDMPTPAEVAKAVLTYDGVIVVPGASKTNPTWTLSSSVTEILKRLDKANTTLAAQSAAITAIAGQLGKNVDTAAVVAAVDKAIADAVIKVDVAVTGQES